MPQEAAAAAKSRRHTQDASLSLCCQVCHVTIGTRRVPATGTATFLLTRRHCFLPTLMLMCADAAEHLVGSGQGLAWNRGTVPRPNRRHALREACNRPQGLLADRLLRACHAVVPWAPGCTLRSPRARTHEHARCAATENTLAQSATQPASSIGGASKHNGQRPTQGHHPGHRHHGHLHRQQGRRSKRGWQACAASTGLPARGADASSMTPPLGAYAVQGGQAQASLPPTSTTLHPSPSPPHTHTTHTCKHMTPPPRVYRRLAPRTLSAWTSTSARPTPPILSSRSWWQKCARS